MTGSDALPTGRVVGDAEPMTFSGPLTAAARIAMATKLSMIVVTTSWAPETAFRKPGMKPHAAPKIMPATSDDGDRRRSAGSSASWTPTMTEPRAPIRNWPWTPMLNRPALKPRPTARPPRSSGIVLLSVLTMARSEPIEPEHERAVGVEGEAGLQRRR